MAIDTNINQLVINKLTNAQYQEARESGSIVETEMYMVTDDNLGSMAYQNVIFHTSTTNLPSVVNGAILIAYDAD